MYRIGIDVGGTFTDLVAIDEGGRTTLAKVPSTPDDPSLGVLDGLRVLAEPLGVTRGLLGETDRIVHGTTVATNALLERKGAQGRAAHDRGPSRRHRDARGAEGRSLQSAHAAARAAGAARICGSACASGCAPTAGSRRRSIRPRSTARSRLCKRERVEAVAVCYLHAWRDPRHEHATREALSARAARRLCLAVVGGAAADQGVRAGLDDDRQRLCRPGAVALSRAARSAARRSRLSAARP